MRTGALVIVPLAAAASAHAGLITSLPTSNFTISCSGTSTGAPGESSDVAAPIQSGGCSGGADPIAGSAGQIGGVSLWLSNGGVDLGSGTGSITMSVRGPGPAIPLGTVIPLSWGFDMETAEVGSQTDPVWTLAYTLADMTTNTQLAFGSFGGNNSGPVFGSGSLTTTAASSYGDTLALKVQFTELGDPKAGFDVIVQIPEFKSFDVDPLMGVPEPSSIGLLGAGLAWLSWQWRKCRQSRLSPFNAPVH
jgi:hypothetical protein